jgi:hypothetical protein
MAKQSDDHFNDEETIARRDAVIKHMLNTPPKPHSAMKIGKRKAKASTKASPPGKNSRTPKVRGDQVRR